MAQSAKPASWYEYHYSEIDRILNHEPDPRRYSIDVDAVIKAKEQLEQWMADHVDTTFQQDLMDRISQKNMSPVSFYKAAFMDRKLFSAIKNNVNYVPKKETAVACCLALHLTSDESADLLAKAGYKLTDAKKWDVIVQYCIRNAIYDIDAVNDLLYHYGEKTIGV